MDTFIPKYIPFKSVGFQILSLCLIIDVFDQKYLGQSRSNEAGALFPQVEAEKRFSFYQQIEPVSLYFLYYSIIPRLLLTHVNTKRRINASNRDFCKPRLHAAGEHRSIASRRD
jgi:hypothetical protein